MGSLNQEWKSLKRKSLIHGQVCLAISQSRKSSKSELRNSALSGVLQVRICTSVSSSAEHTRQRGEARCWRWCISTPDGVSPLMQLVMNFRGAKDVCFLALVMLVHITLLRRMFRPHPIYLQDMCPFLFCHQIQVRSCLSALRLHEFVFSLNQCLKTTTYSSSKILVV